MMFIAIPVNELENLQTGVVVRINGEPETIVRDGEYLCYRENRCRIISEDVQGKLVYYTAASHGQDTTECEVIYPQFDVEERFRSQLPYRK